MTRRALPYGVRIPAKESAILGRSVTVVTSAGERIAAQVWSAADPTLIGSRRSDAAWFAVADDRTVYVFGESGAYLMERRERDHRDPGQGAGYVLPKYIGKAVMGAERGETVPELEIETPAPVAPKRTPRKRAVRKPSELAPVPAVPATVPAPMPAMTRAARKQSNRELAAAMRAARIGITPETWHAAKSGELAGFTFTTAGV